MSRVMVSWLLAVSANAFADVPSEDVHPGERYYKKVCYACHDRGTEDVAARGAPRLGNTNAWDSLRKRGVDALFISVISQRPDGLLMPRAELTDDQVKQAIEYMLIMADPRAQASRNVEPSRGIPTLD